ncbi:hypothetical protein L3X38_000556 [Prunus dulcis]|uniref:Uncharacterized protein n=1 Tax=Prunus dulcis TaxID=3755 RepID=A0AAD4WQI6_PRUDU|nr:hypothetical protein L3X38_000556 [Prunus dulcis]
MAHKKKVQNFLRRLDQFQFGRQFQALGPVNQTVLSPNQPPKPMHCIEMWKVLSVIRMICLVMGQLRPCLLW